MQNLTGHVLAVTVSLPQKHNIAETVYVMKALYVTIIKVRAQIVALVVSFNFKIEGMGAIVV